MAMTMAQSLANELRRQVTLAETLAGLAGVGSDNDRSDTLIGDERNVLSIRGNLADVARMNQLWYRTAIESGALPSHAPVESLAGKAPADFQEFIAFIQLRDTATSEEALELLRQVNETLAQSVEGFSDEQLDVPVRFFRPIPLTLRDVLFRILTHGSLHCGQAWGMMKSAGITDHGFEALIPRPKMD